VAIPAYLEPNGRAAIPSRLRPATGGTLEVQLLPRPPLGTASLANADQGAAASVSWVDDDGASHSEPLWLLVNLPGGDPVAEPPPAEGLVEADRYGGTFARARATSVNLDDGLEHAFVFALARVAGPAGELLADTAALRQLGGAAWFDRGGQLGHVKAINGQDFTAGAMADRIDSGELCHGKLDVTDPAHPALQLTHGPALEGGRRRATLGDLVAVMGEPARTLQLREAGPNEIDVVGVTIVVAPEPPGPQPGDPWSSGVTVEELARSLAVAVPPSGSGPVVDRLRLAIATAEDAVGAYTGRRTAGDWPATVPAGPHVAVLQLATRIYRAADVTFGVLQTELGTAYTGRWITPELDAALIGWRRSWGIA
jgi:hypothetical protein